MTPRTLAAVVAAVVLAGTACTGGSVAAPSQSGAPRAVASPTPEPLALERLARFSGPVWVGPAPGDPDHLFLVEQAGRVLQLDANGNQQSVVLDLTGEVTRGSEQGLLSIAFDPAYATNKRMYVDYTDKDGDTRVVAYTVRNGVAVKPQLLYAVEQPYANHNGGQLLFDSTGMLLVGLGDGGSAGDPQNRAQDLLSDLGKVLRLDPRTGDAAPGNPFPQNPKVWMLGLRNPWRFAFDTNGDLYLGDVGQNKQEELDVVAPEFQKGANFGWSVYEGTGTFKRDQVITHGRLIDPTLTYQHAEGGCSITGGVVYRGRVLRELEGSYVFGDFCMGQVWAVTRHSVGVTPIRELGPKVDGLLAVGQDLRGEVLVCATDGLYRLVAA